MIVVKKDEAFHQYSHFVSFLRLQDCPAFTLFIYILTSLNAPLLPPLIARPNDLIKSLPHSHHHNRQRPKQLFARVQTPVSPCYKLRLVILVSINAIVFIRISSNSQSPHISPNVRFTPPSLKRVYVVLFVFLPPNSSQLILYLHFLCITCVKVL